ncbi:dihydrodipicolinate synthase family protein [Actinomadura monticuli]|uniref:Dihydrodipicolinate synthase family protein n=1 Tax=Actinomadura monticuli TaxID=3097367 RepID=A0ABV4QJ54_9ACTN
MEVARLDGRVHDGFFSLAPEEVGRVVRAAVEEAPDGLPVIAPAGYGTATAARMAREAEDAGADGVLLFPPYLTEASQDGLVARGHAGHRAVRRARPPAAHGPHRRRDRRARGAREAGALRCRDRPPGRRPPTGSPGRRGGPASRAAVNGGCWSRGRTRMT